MSAPGSLLALAHLHENLRGLESRVGSSSSEESDAVFVCLGDGFSGPVFDWNQMVHLWNIKMSMY